MTTLPFDPTSPGARRLARGWLPQLERWEMRVPAGHFYTEDDGTLIEPGRRIEVGAPFGRQLADRGYELIGIRRAHAHD